MNTSEYQFCLNSWFCLLKNYRKLRKWGDNGFPCGVCCCSLYFSSSYLGFFFFFFHQITTLVGVRVIQIHLFFCEPLFGRAVCQQRIDSTTQTDALLIRVNDFKMSNVFEPKEDIISLNTILGLFCHMIIWNTVNIFMCQCCWPKLERQDRHRLLCL